jgi:hypothetical protein
MTRIAIRRSLRGAGRHAPARSVAYEPEPNAKGERVIWLEEVWLSKLDATRKPGESCSDVILRLVDLGGGIGPDGAEGL